MKKMQENQAITLVALVITVIIMLILAGVAISLTIGNNGIFGKSKEGVQIYQNSANKETNSLNGIDEEMGAFMNQYQDSNTTGPTVIPGNPDKNGIYTQNSTINGGRAEAFNPEIPKGFKPVNEESANWGNGSNSPREEAVKAGLIIEDEEGNQFVWVAVDGTDVVLGRYVFTETGEIDTALSKTELGAQLKTNSSNSAYFLEPLKEDTTPNVHAIDIEQFYRSVTEHGGYYIARYEASYGIDGKPNSKISIEVVNGATKEGQLWTYIKQADAAKVCRKMYDENYGITSDLMNSFAWDTAIVFIQQYSGDTHYSRQDGFSINSSLTNTGVNGDERCHIHDMASNCQEWSTEILSFKPCVARGGHYAHNRDYTSFRTIGSETTSSEPGISFRPILYLK